MAPRLAWLPLVLAPPVCMPPPCLTAHSALHPPCSLLCSDMLERTLAGKGSLGGGGGVSVSRNATASPTVASAAGTLSQSAFGSGVPLPPTPNSPGPLGAGDAAAAPGTVQARGRLSSGMSGASRTASETGTQASGYSSMAAEVGSLEDGMPRTLLGSSAQRSQ